jgi:hypothetical protein
MATKRLNYPIEPMDLANMRENGVRSLAVICPDDTKAMLLESGSEFSRGHLRLSNWFIGARHRASLSPPGGYRRDATKRALTNMYSGVEPIPRERRPKFEGVPNKGRRRCHDSHFRRPRADFSASMRWNGP